MVHYAHELHVKLTFWLALIRLSMTLMTWSNFRSSQFTESIAINNSMINHSHNEAHDFFKETW